jgi:hypothetical protein
MTVINTVRMISCRKLLIVYVMHPEEVDTASGLNETLTEKTDFAAV